MCESELRPVFMDREMAYDYHLRLKGDLRAQETELAKLGAIEAITAEQRQEAKDIVINKKKRILKWMQAIHKAWRFE